MMQEDPFPSFVEYKGNVGATPCETSGAQRSQCAAKRAKRWQKEERPGEGDSVRSPLWTTTDRTGPE